jgi:hypothetical protein
LRLSAFFTGIVQRNLHVIFTANPVAELEEPFNYQASMFNHCYVDWFGTWGSKAMGEVGRAFLAVEHGWAGLGESGGGEALMQQGVADYMQI